MIKPTNPACTVNVETMSLSEARSGKDSKLIISSSTANVDNTVSTSSIPMKNISLATVFDSETRNDSIEMISNADMLPFGPDPTTMAEILENSLFSFRTTPSWRKLFIDDQPANPGFKICCTGIPPEIFEDNITKLLNYEEEDPPLIQEICLLMDPGTETNKGIAIITFYDKQYAEEALNKLDGYEIIPGRRLHAEEISFEDYDIHICIDSSPSNYCSCIQQMFEQVLPLKSMVSKLEETADPKKVQRAREENIQQYASHSLRMEDISPTEESIFRICEASHYAAALDHITLENVVKIHRIICPELYEETDEEKMFRDDEVFINGIYNLMRYGSGPDVLKQEMEAVIKDLNSMSEVEDDREAILRAANIKARFLEIHPFSDGNGRCSRVLFGAILRKRNFPWVTIPKDDSTRYYEALRMLFEYEDFSMLYRFSCRCIIRSMKRYLANIQS